MPGKAGIETYISELEKILMDMESIPSQIEHKALEVTRAYREANQEYTEGSLYRCNFRHFIKRLRNLIDSIKKDSHADSPKDDDMRRVRGEQS